MRRFLSALTRRWRPAQTPAPVRPDPGIAHASASAAAVAGFERALGIGFGDGRLLSQALTHRSYVGEQALDISSNERMEFLGDSVLELVVNEFLYRRFPESREGELTKHRSLLVSRAILARKSRELGLGRFLLLSDAEHESGGRDRDSILSDSYEAVVGAIYLDQGMTAARLFIERSLLADAERILSDRTHLNFKSLLQEHVQSTSHSQPRYRVREENGPDHAKTFIVDVAVRGTVLGSGVGRNKKEAEQFAARDALIRLEELDDHPGGTAETGPADRPLD